MIPLAIGLGLAGLGAAGAGVYFFLMRARGEERVAVTQQAVAQLRAELDGYFAHQGSYPNNINELGEVSERLLAMSLTGSPDVRAVRFKDVLPGIDELRSQCAHEREGSYGWLYDVRGLVVACPTGEINTAQWAWPVPLSFPNLSDEGEGGEVQQGPSAPGPGGSPPGEGSTVAPAPPEEGWKPDLVVISAVAPLRSKAAQHGRIVARLRLGEGLAKKGQNGPWFRVLRESGQVGWISGYDIKFIEPTGSP
ncbi:MAG: hypothetical protein HYY13_11790 [Nitrospirae bacterium]|nr:hypothetical protein [Nitrospirota bacterium]